LLEMIRTLLGGSLAEAFDAIGSIGGGGAVLGSLVAAASGWLAGDKRSVVLEKAALSGLLGGGLAVLLVVGLNKPVPALEHDRPIDLIARGEHRRVADVLAGLETPSFS
jgi:hypothetical protein